MLVCRAAPIIAKVNTTKLAVADTCALEHGGRIFLRYPAGTPFRSADPDFFEHTRC